MRIQTSGLAARLAAVALGASILAPASAATILRGPTLAHPYAPAQTVPGRLSPDVLTFTFTKLDDKANPGFNQLLGINYTGEICGYFGSGLAGHPNKGYTLLPPYGQTNYTNENFPGSVQTQVTGINNNGYTAGFWIDTKGNNFGFLDWNGVFTSYRDPGTGTGTVNQLLGVNDAGIAVGFFTDGHGVNHGYMLNRLTGKFTPVVPPGGSNVMATAINKLGDITGSYTVTGGSVSGYLLKGGKFSIFSFPMAMATTPFGINKSDQIVGSYVDAGGKTHGFLLSNPTTTPTWQSIDDPHGIGTTIVNGLNEKDDLVGFYVDSQGHTDGFLATPVH